MRILIVGLGGAGQRLVRHFRALLGSEAEFITARDRDDSPVIHPDFSTDSSQGIEAHYAIQRFPSLDDALATHPDVAIVANPTSLHVATATKAASAGSHVLIEKPLGDSLSHIGDLKDQLDGRVGYVGYMMRFHPCLQRIHQILEQQDLGSVLWAHMEAGSYVPSWHPYEDYSRLYAIWIHLGGGVVLTESHELDLALWFFGHPRRTFATGGKLTAHLGDAEDTASIILDCGFPVQVNLCFMQRPPSRSVTIALERGRIEWSGDAILRIYEAERGWTSFEVQDFERETLFRAEVAHFIQCVRGEASPLVDVTTAAESLSIALDALAQIRGTNGYR